MRHKSKADKFFTDEEKIRIKETTRNVESRTMGEIAVMVVDSSGQYLDAEIIGGLIFGSLLSLFLTVLYFNSTVWSYIPLSFLFFFPSRFIVRKTPLIKAMFIGAVRKNHTVREMAVRAFYEKGLYKTKKSTGILFFLSLLERKVWILADKGIHKKIGQNTLNKFAKVVTQGIRDGRACIALCEAITEAGELLAIHFPKKPGDIDELPDDVMTE